MNGEELREKFSEKIAQVLNKIDPITWEQLSDGRKKVWDEFAAEVTASAAAKLPRDDRYAYKGEPRKALISPGFGAGWSTWNSEYRHEFLFDPELIAAVESFERSGDREADRGEMREHLGLIQDNYPTHLRPQSPLANFEERMKLEYGDGDDGFHGYYGGCDDLEVREIDGQFMVDEYDGSESITLRGKDDGWI